MKKVLLIIMAILSIGSIIFVYNDYFLYKNTIMKVTEVKNIENGEEASEEPIYTQKIKGIIKNGKYKNNIVETTNEYSESLVFEDKIEKNNELFVELSSNGKKVVTITGIKRDKYLAILTVIFIDLIILIAGRKGLKTLLSLFINICITLATILYIMNHSKTVNILLLFSIISIIFIVLSLFITNGKSKKTLAAIVSSIVSLLISFGLSYLFIKSSEDNIYIWNMSYIEAIHDYNNYLYVSVLLCGLGAIMDISITISSALNELIMKNNKIKKEALIKSGRIISKDIVGTMINVMLFTCYTSVIPTIIIAVRNKIGFINAIDFYGSLELMIVLCNCIGIVLTIPISLLVSILILDNKKGSGNNE